MFSNFRQKGRNTDASKSFSKSMIPLRSIYNNEDEPWSITDDTTQSAAKLFKSAINNPSVIMKSIDAKQRLVSDY